MTLREHLSGVESVANLTGLGRLADRAALAVHRAETGALSDEDREALDNARALLVQLQSFAGVTVPTRIALQTMGPISVLEETFGAVSRTNDQVDVGALVNGLIDSIDAIVAGSGTADQIHSVATFFDGLGAVTLNRTTSMARRGPERRQRWMSEALSSSEG